MDTMSIRYFLRVAECLNFSEAADQNHISQSSFSKAIIRLEKELGVKLIDRSHHPIALTPAGSCFYQHFKAMEPMFLEAMEQLADCTHREQIRCYLCPKSFAVKSAFRDFEGEFESLEFHFTESSEISTVVERMLTGDYDFAISYRPFLVPPQLKMTTLLTDELYLVAGKDSPFAQRSAVSLMECSGLTFFEGVFTRFLLEELMRYFSFTPRRIYPEGEDPMRREEAMYRISRGQGVGIFLGRDLSAFSAADVVFIPIPEVPEMPMVLLERVDAPDSVGKRQFRKWAQDNLERYMCDRLDPARWNG